MPVDDWGSLSPHYLPFHSGMGAVSRWKWRPGRVNVSCANTIGPYQLHIIISCQAGCFIFREETPSRGHCRLHEGRGMGKWPTITRISAQANAFSNIILLCQAMCVHRDAVIMLHEVVATMCTMVKRLAGCHSRHSLPPRSDTS